MITIHNLKDEKPTHPYDIRVHRNHILGNPFFMANESQRDDVCDKYDTWFNENMSQILPELKRLLEIYLEYGNLRLFCWCAPKRCHAETIKKWLEGMIK